MRTLLGHLGGGAATVTVALLSWGWPVAALAQEAAKAAPQPSLRKAPPLWLGYVVIFLLLAVVLAISLMPSKRGHRD